MSADNEPLRTAIAKGLDAPRPFGLFSDTITNIINEITAAGYVVERDWQPIETAPRDEKILLWGGKWIGVRPGKWNDDSYGKRPRPYWDYTGTATMDSRANQPTHWRPLPAPPEATP